MRRAPTPPPRDPEFDGHGRAGRAPTGPAVIYYQRLVVNPFLGLAGFGLTLAAAWHLSWPPRRGPYLGLVSLAGVSASYLLLQYHCLDCGATGMYHGWREHACWGVRDRWNSPDAFRAHLFPTPKTQLVLWLLSFLAVGVWIMAGLRR